MAKTLLDLQTGIRTYLDEAAQTDFLDTEVISAANQAYHDVIGHVIEVYENFYDTTTPFKYTVTAGQQEYQIDPSLIKVTRVEINYKPTDVNTIPVRAISIKSDEMGLNLSNNKTAPGFYNSGYYLHGPIGAQKVGLAPIPTVTDPVGTQSLSVWGTALPTDLVAPTDNLNIPYIDRYVYLVNLKAAAILLRKGQQAEVEARNYIAEYEAGIRQMQTFLFERQADGPRMIEVNAVDNIDFGTLGNL